MRIEQTARLFGLALAFSLSACGSVLQSPDAGTDSRTDTGHDGGGVACRQLNEADCRARPDCAVGLCSDVCGGGSSFPGCYDPASEAPPPCVGLGVACPAP